MHDGDLHVKEMTRGTEGEDVRRVHDYLKRFGYLPSERFADVKGWRPAVEKDVADPNVFDELMEEAVVLYQAQNALKPDGVVGPKTIARMRERRCGNPDVVTRDGPQPFVLSGSRWTTNELRYSFDNTGVDLTEAEVGAALRGAFDRWEQASPLTFTEVAAGASAETRIGWFTRDHGDANPFDDAGSLAGNVLAHCFYPPPRGGSFPGDCHFDEHEEWSLTPPTGIDLLTVAIHELGHGLGLDHSNVRSAVMFASYGGPRRELNSDDVNGIRAIYGR
jgi:Matrixin/Putative peptidoglycan binding domain